MKCRKSCIWKDRASVGYILPYHPLTEKVTNVSIDESDDDDANAAVGNLLQQLCFNHCNTYMRILSHFLLMLEGGTLIH